MYGVWHRDNPGKPLRNRRTKDGCLTCKRRRVRCNLERPCCDHCLRLHLDCHWSGPRSTPTAANATLDQEVSACKAVGSQPTPRVLSSVERVQPSHDQSHKESPLDQSQKQQQQQLQPQGEVPVLSTPTSELDPTTAVDRSQVLSFEQTFDFASFLWDPTAFNNTLPDLPMNQWMPTANSLLLSGETPSFEVDGSGGGPQYQDSPPNPTRYNDSQLIEHFKLSHAPPILAPMETRSSWYPIRDQILSMVPISPMVHFAVLAFSALQIRNDTGHSSSTTFSSYYIRSQEHITTSTLEVQANPGAVGSRARYVLAALFLLSIVDLVTDRTSSAHVNLRMAHDIMTSLDQENLSFAEKLLISGFRLLDARVVSAGGEWLLLKEDGDVYDSSRGQSTNKNDTEAMVFEMLSEPSLRLFQKTQSFMGRIAQIDQCHRERGTVEDETEVMAIASEIRRDYRRLFQQLHPILEQAVSGNLCPPLLSPSLAASVTRKCRIAMANYYAVPIHLHRVAYRHLPRSTDLAVALSEMQRLMHDMRETLADEEALPANMLWPLLIWGSEEENADQRAWIIKAIRQMANSVSNAAITADALEELWKSQDSRGSRYDI